LTSPGAAAGGFSAVGRSDGIYVELTAQGVTAVDSIPVGSPTAQAQVDSLGNSRGFSAMTYPGEAIATLPELAGFASGGAVSLPSYPLLVKSDPTTPDQKIDHGGVLLQSHSDRTATTAVARVGSSTSDSSVGLVEARAEARATGAAPVASSHAVVEAFRAGPLAIGGVVSEAEATRSSDGTVTRRSLLKVSAISVAGQAVELTDKGLAVAGGQPNPLPSNDPVAAVLAQAGLSVRSLAPIQDVDGIVSAGVEVLWQRQIPGFGKGAVRYVFGRSVAHVASGPGGADGTLPPGGITTGVGAEPTGAASAVPTSPGTGPTAGQVAAVPGAPAASSGDAVTASPRSAPALVPVARTTWGSGFYLAIAGAGIVMLGGLQLVRLIGVRLGWSSS
jgi:hypothetical protein